MSCSALQMGKWRRNWYSTIGPVASREHVTFFFHFLPILGPPAPLPRRTALACAKGKKGPPLSHVCPCVSLCVWAQATRTGRWMSLDDTFRHVPRVLEVDLPLSFALGQY